MTDHWQTFGGREDMDQILGCLRRIADSLEKLADPSILLMTKEDVSQHGKDLSERVASVLEKMAQQQEESSHGTRDDGQ